MGEKLVRILAWVGVVILQLIMSQVTTFLASLLFPGMEKIQQTSSALFAAILAFTFTLGIFLVGWLAIKWHWLKEKPMTLYRLGGTLLGAILPLIIALVIYPSLEPGNPFFFISILVSILGFHLPGWVMRGNKNGTKQIVL